jgi:ribonuclease BN (tRNA processing enzyme)
VRITVLGKSPSWQDAGGACSGYLVQEGGTSLLVDCGNGVFGKLRQHLDYVDVDAVLVSHLHADHFLDVVPYAYALTYAPRQQPVPVDRWPGTDTPARPRLIAPKGAAHTLRRIVGTWGAEDLVDNAFDIHEYTPSQELEIGALRVRLHEVPHFLPTCAIEVRGAADGAARFTYGADSAPTEAIVEFAQGTDLLMLEATLPWPERDGVRGHLTPAEAGEHGRRAGAKRLVLTHFSDEMDEQWARDEAQRSFGAPVSVAREGAVYDL